MDKFTVHRGVAAPLLKPNIDTDLIIRVERFMYYPRGQLGPYCFETWRYRPDGSEDPGFVLNTDAYRGASILLAGPNFGCGSSREAAVWSMWDMGLRCVIAPSFGDIFHENCFQVGLLAVTLPAETIAALSEDGAAAARASNERPQTTVDLERQLITSPTGRTFPFTVDASRRRALLEGLDEIGLTLLSQAAIADFQARDRKERPWIYSGLDRDITGGE
jgi:3-isopropylmalate/(R)-2-methylmalate dehydratase small subunit